MGRADHAGEDHAEDAGRVCAEREGGPRALEQVDDHQREPAVEPPARPLGHEPHPVPETPRAPLHATREGAVRHACLRGQGARGQVHGVPPLRPRGRLQRLDQIHAAHLHPQLRGGPERQPDCPGGVQGEEHQRQPADHQHGPGAGPDRGVPHESGSGEGGLDLPPELPPRHLVAAEAGDAAGGGRAERGGNARRVPPLADE
mmetsp:Transcript_40459/g.55071  ORF Transcript_40459/g.55071 Transcript_40459/m.55071 type:complete len:202 (-) Transcript_40459:759-1364(-)